MKKMCVAVGVLVLSVCAHPALAAGYPDGHHEDPESTAAEAAALCLGWPKEAAYTLRLRVHSPESGDAARKWTSEEDVLGGGQPTVVTVQPYRGLEQRTCTTRSVTANDLQYDGTKAMAFMRSPEGVIGWAIKKLDASDLPPDSFEFLTVGPVLIGQ